MSLPVLCPMYKFGILGGLDLARISMKNAYSIANNSDLECLSPAQLVSIKF